LIKHVKAIVKLGVISREQSHASGRAIEVKMI
jgi:hypothetical protein